MKVLHISNHNTLRCGVGEFGRQLSAAARAAGVDVTDWDGDYPECHRRGYFPEDVYQYDVVHFNWQPGVLNHYQPEPVQHVLDGWGGRRPKLSGLLHDLPPWSTWALEPLLDVKVALEPYQDYVVIPPPCLPPRPPLPLTTYPTIGRTGIGMEGYATLADICRRHNWDLDVSVPDAWMSNDDEIDRLSRCWVNVVWYNTCRSRSSSASIVATARRPTILSDSTRFDHLRLWPEEFYEAPSSDAGVLDALLQGIVGRIAAGQDADLLHPDRCVAALQWPRLIRPLVSAWEASCASV